MKHIKEILSVIGLIFIAIFTMKKPSDIKLDKVAEKELKDKEDKVISDIKVIDKKITEIKQDGVKELSPEEEVDYWKKEFGE